MRTQSRIVGFNPANVVVQSFSITHIAALKQPGSECSSIIYDTPCLLALMEFVSSPVVVVDGLEGVPHG